MGGQISTGALLLVAAMFAVAVVMVAVLAARRPAGGGRLEADLEQLGQLLSTNVVPAMQDLQAQVVDLRLRVEATKANLSDKTFQVQAALQKEISEAQKLVGEVRAELTARRQRDEEVGRAVKRLEAVLAGSASKGAAGENILDDAFSSFPPGMVERNFRVRGKVVEYALVLTGSGRRLPIDSKWPATQAFEVLAGDDPDPAVRKKAATEVRTILRQKVREVAQYIDPSSTTDEAIAAVPDAAYPFCGEITFDAYRQGVIIMPYSMIVPYVLNLYNLHLRYSRSVELDTLDNALLEIERNVDTLNKVLENSVQRGATMISNAYGEIKQAGDRIRAALIGVRALPAVKEHAALSEGELVTAAGVDTAVGEDALGVPRETLGN